MGADSSSSMAAPSPRATALQDPVRSSILARIALLVRSDSTWAAELGQETADRDLADGCPERSAELPPAGRLLDAGRRSHAQPRAPARERAAHRQPVLV